jgi:hypothetical protein
MPIRAESPKTPQKRVPHLRRSFIAAKVGYFVSTALYSLLLLPAISPSDRLHAQSAPTDKRAPSLRPMTFEDMMQMRRLGDTDVSPDGKWLLYSVTDVDLAKNTRTPKLWIQPISGGDPKLVEGTQPGDSSASPATESTCSSSLAAAAASKSGSPTSIRQRVPQLTLEVRQLSIEILKPT